MSTAPVVDGSGNSAFLPPQAPPAPSRGRAWLKLMAMLVLWFVGGGLAGALGAWAGLRFEPLLPPVSWWLVLGVAVAMVWPHIVLHEAGHAALGIARGMQPMAFGIGPLRWDRGASGWRFRRGTAVAGISGFAALLPVGERGLSRVDQALYLLGGPLANLATGALALGLLPLAGDNRWVASALLGSGASALLLGLVNLVPFHSQGWRSDGRGLLDLLRRSPEAALQQRLTQVMALNMAGVRPRDWPEALVPQALDAPSSPMLAVNGDLLRLSWAMDRGDATAAAAAARRATAAFHTVPEALRPHVAVALAGHAARSLRDPALLAAWRPLCEGGVTDLALMRDWLDAERAVLTDAPAGDALRVAREGLDRAPDPVTGLLLREYLADLAQRARG